MEKRFKIFDTLKLISTKSVKNPNHKFQRIFHLLHDEGILFQAMGTISKKKGALTPGPPSDQSTADVSDLKLIKSISEDLKSGNFSFKPIRRIYLDKNTKELVAGEKLIQLENLYKNNEFQL